VRVQFSGLQRLKAQGLVRRAEGQPGLAEERVDEFGPALDGLEPGVIDAANHGGTYTWPVNGQTYPRIQVITVAELLAHKRPDMPPPNLPYIQAARAVPSASQQMTLDSRLDT
jgi:hypothetical protein